MSTVMPRPTQLLIDALRALGEKAPDDYQPEDRALFAEMRDATNLGLIRCAERSPDGQWTTNVWYKKALLAGFRLGQNLEQEGYCRINFFDKQTLPVRELFLSNQVRLVPGGSSIRDGAFIGEGVIVMPPSYVNIGAYVGRSTLVDSHVLVGSCAQIGERVHLSAGVMIGGVLEPVGALPVIVEDDVVVGGNCGVYEGTIVRAASGARNRGRIERFDQGVRHRQRNHSRSAGRRTADHSRRRGRRARKPTGGRCFRRAT